MFLLDISNIWIVQAAQLPLVAMIVLLIFITARNSKSNLAIADGSSGAPFMIFANKWIGVGLLFNIFYLGADIVSASNHFKFIKDYKHYYIVVFDLVTTFWFYIAFITWFYLKKKAANKNPVSKTRAKGLLIQKFYIISITTIITLLVGYISLAQVTAHYVLPSPDSGVVSLGAFFYIFNFIGYLLITYYLSSMTLTRSSDRKNYWFINYIAFGFLLWSILQLLDPVAAWVRLEPVNVKFTGFSLSTLSKCAILWGFFMLYLGQDKVSILSQQSLLQQNIDSLRKLQRMINEISLSANSGELVAKCLSHLSKSALFRFDYVIFSKVNNLKQKITYADCIPKKTLRRVEDWVLPDGIPLDHHDVLAQAVRKKAVVHVRGNVMDDQPLDLYDQLCPLNRDVYTKYEHDKLDRYFVPVMNFPDKADGEELINGPNKVLAILELGYFTDEPRKEKIAANQGELDIYIDNLAQQYRRLREDGRLGRVEKILETCDLTTKDDYLGYLTEILEQTCLYINAAHGVIAILPATIGSLANNPDLVYFEIGPKERKRIKTIFQNIAASRDIISWTVDEAGTNALEKMQQLLEVPSAKKFIIHLSETETGVLFLFGKRADYFNDDNDSVTEKIITGIKAVYNEKKFHSAVASLVVPNNAFTDPEQNINPVMESIRQYFATDFVSVWLKDNTPENRNKNAFIQKYSTEELRKRVKNYANNTIVLDEMQRVPEQVPVKLDTSEPVDENRAFWKFGGKSHLKSFVHVPLVSGDHVLGFINIYFGNEIREPLFENTRFLNLIAVKSAMTLQVQNLIVAFTDISASLTQNNLGVTLRVITEKAVELLNADPVILFKSKKGTEVFIKDVIYSSYEPFRDESIKELFKKEDVHAELAELIINDKSRYFSDAEEYRKYIIKNPRKNERNTFGNDFWHQEEIKSMASIRLVYRSKPVGVLFINFRRPVKFTEETKKIIQTFADLAAGAIESGYTFERNRQYLLRNFKLTKPLLNELKTSGALHNAHKTYMSIHAKFFLLIREIDRQYFQDIKTWVKELRSMLNEFQPIMYTLFDEFKTLEQYYKSDNTLDIRRHNISGIMDSQLTLLDPDLRHKLIDVTKSYSPLLYADCDEPQIAHVFYNLLNNAIQAMHTRGNLEVRMNIADNNLVAEVIDDGPGISQVIRHIIMQPYATDKEGGSGLGLAISKLVAEQHGGSLTYNSNEKRTNFRVSIPVINLTPKPATTDNAG